MGPNTDGGYLLPNVLDGMNTVFSLGVDRQMGFEEDAARRGMKAFMADASIDCPATANKPDSPFFFIPKFVGAHRTKQRITFDDFYKWSQVDEGEEWILQMDIEGDEYPVLLNMSDAHMERTRILIVEFHGLTGLFSPGLFSMIHTCFRKILQTHRVVHIHPNNYGGLVVKRGITIPGLMEFTFLRKDCGTFSPLEHDFPHPLDVENTPLRPLPLPENWYF